MLPEANNLLCISCVQFIKGASNAIVGKPANVRRVSETPLSIEHQINKPVLNFNFWRFVQQLGHVFHSDSSSPKKRDPLFSFEDVTARNEMQTLTLVNNKQSFAMVLK